MPCSPFCVSQCSYPLVLCCDVVVLDEAQQHPRGSSRCPHVGSAEPFPAPPRHPFGVRGGAAAAQWTRPGQVGAGGGGKEAGRGVIDVCAFVSVTVCVSVCSYLYIASCACASHVSVSVCVGICCPPMPSSCAWWPPSRPHTHTPPHTCPSSKTTPLGQGTHAKWYKGTSVGSKHTDGSPHNGRVDALHGIMRLQSFWPSRGWLERP